MTQQNRPPEPRDNDWMTWARRLSTYLSTTRSALVQQTGDERAPEDGVMMWDRSGGYPVVSKAGEWRQIILSDGRYLGGVTADQTAASANTAYYLTYTSSIADGIANDGTNPERIVFEESGEYLISFSAQISSGSGSSVDFYFWPRINGTDQDGSTMVNTLKNRNARLVVSRSALFTVSAGDYLEVMWATSNTNGFLNATAATAFCPAAPASTLAITRIHA